MPLTNAQKTKKAKKKETGKTIRQTINQLDAAELLERKIRSARYVEINATPHQGQSLAIINKKHRGWLDQVTTWNHRSAPCGNSAHKIATLASLNVRETTITYDEDTGYPSLTTKRWAVKAGGKIGPCPYTTSPTYYDREGMASYTSDGGFDDGFSTLMDGTESRKGQTLGHTQGLTGSCTGNGFDTVQPCATPTKNTHTIDGFKYDPRSPLSPLEPSTPAPKNRTIKVQARPSQLGIYTEGGEKADEPIRHTIQPSKLSPIEWNYLIARSFFGLDLNK